jgi:DNA replication and repair protein RecF
MSLAKLDVFNVRNIETASLAPSPRLNFLLGANGSGKTSLVEAVYILGRARSFRSSQVGQVISFTKENLTVAGRALQAPKVPPVAIGVELSRRHREIVVSGKKLKSSAELITAFPVLLIQPTSTALLDGAPKNRRQFLDWGAFHLEPAFLENWRGYIRALSQRNALLRDADLRNLEIWNHELDRYGTMVAEARETYVNRLRSYFLEAARFFLGQHSFELHASAGWDTRKPLMEVLREGVVADRSCGYTCAGPHRGDFSVVADGRPAKNFLSRGQMKLLVFALLLAQAHLLEEAVGLRGCVLIDDLASELDCQNRDKLLRFLEMRKAQFFVTATDRRLLDSSHLADAAVFHVEHGRVIQA